MYVDKNEDLEILIFRNRSCFFSIPQFIYYLRIQWTNAMQANKCIPINKLNQWSVKFTSIIIRHIKTGLSESVISSSFVIEVWFDQIYTKPFLLLYPFILCDQMRVTKSQRILTLSMSLVKFLCRFRIEFHNYMNFVSHFTCFYSMRYYIFFDLILFT